MQVRSWMAAVVLITGSTALLAGMARSQKPGSDQPPPVAAGQNAGSPKTSDSQSPTDPAKRSATGNQTIKLNIMIAGLGHDGCAVDIKPGNRSTRFKPQHQRVDSRGEAKFVFQDIEAIGADRNCTFAITVHEAGQADRTIYRGFRVATRAAFVPSPQGVQSFTCYMNAPSKLAGLEPPSQIRR